MYYSKFLRSSDFNWSLNCKMIFNQLLEFKKTFSVYTDRDAIIKKKGGHNQNQNYPNSVRAVPIPKIFALH